MELHIKLAGILLSVVALLHFFFPKYFNWKQEFGSFSLINREIIYVHSFFIALIVFLGGLLCLTSSSDLLNTALGKRISLGFGIFWGFRLCVQFFGYSSKACKGKKFDTTIYVVFSMFWTYFCTIFILVYVAD